MRCLGTLILIVLLAGGAAYYFLRGQGSKEALEAESKGGSTTERIKDSVKHAMDELALDPDKIKEELEKTGRVVRTKAKEVGSVLAQATEGAQTTAAIKAKLLADSGLSSLTISVNTTDGVVTLSGRVNIHEDIGKAMELAMRTDGVREVISTLQVKQKKDDGAPASGGTK